MVDSAQRRGKGSKNELPTSSGEIDPMEDSTQTVCALRDPELTKNTDYVKAVLGSYINVKKSHGRPVEAISKKLEPLEEEVSPWSKRSLDNQLTSDSFAQYPRLADSFVAIRKEHGLPSSNILEPPAKVKLSERVAERRHLHRKGAGAEQEKV
ncbi:hypothetical protein L198_01662 [Cryptococcus wingfieldii CBS 7118]|uniref:Uncharacterized protein n=1 Tax=Cryptococcus wingfieldii CBS 7118 TaxID=1295528 RepID=A0A1E3K007_9TREE|nr:hypothetical protein L198_01662 [Cryptococcus wingfieldii CBS 7118]ODO06430.1 hypothetical protein L198_01662 [Cryptococcus wingfieldii CBS 7118]